MTVLLFIVTVVLLIGLPVAAVVFSRILSELSHQQKQIDRLGIRIDALREQSGLAEVPRGTPSVTQPTVASAAPAAPAVPAKAAQAATRAMPVAPAASVTSGAPVTSAAPVTVAMMAAAHAAPEKDAATGRMSHADQSIDTIETLIGSRWLLYIGVIAIVIGAAYFEKLAFENHWIGETARVIQGGIVGLALVYAGTRFVRAGYNVYGQMISGCGAAILYVSTYAAFNYYHLIDRPVAFLVMIAITVGTAVLADRQRSQGLAVLAVGGGFATPFMLPGTTDAQTALFSYDAILIAGTVALSRRRDWPLLDVIAYVFTVITVAAWADRFYTPEKFLRTEIFLTVFCAMFLAILYAHRRATSNGVFVAKLILWTAPVAYYLTSLVILSEHPTALLVWLVCLALVSAIVTATIGVRAAFGVWLATAVPLLLWCASHGSPTWIGSGLISVAAVYSIALAAQFYRESERAPFGAIDIVWLHLNGLLMFSAAYSLIEPVRDSATASVAFGFAAWHGALAVGLIARNRDRALHFAGVAFTLLMIAIGLQFQGPSVTIGWAAEGAVVIALGVRERREWLRLGGVALFIVALARTGSLLVGPVPIDYTPVFNSHAAGAAFVIALCYAMAWLYQRQKDLPQRQAYMAGMLIAAQLITVMLITSEIDAYWSARGDALTREMAKSVAWAVYATLTIVVGLWRDYAPIRYFAMALFALTTTKVFFVDMAHLERVYRILSIIGLGVAMLVTSYLYQRVRREKAIDV